jgi:hypothetical protein
MLTMPISWYFLENATGHKQHTNLDNIGFQQNIVTIKHHTLDPFGQVAMVIIFACKDGFFYLQTLLSTKWVRLNSGHWLLRKS